MLYCFRRILNFFRYLQEKYVDCQDINYSDDEEGDRRRVMKSEKIPTNLVMHSAFHNETDQTHYSQVLAGGVTPTDQKGRRYMTGNDGGFCEVNKAYLIRTYYITYPFVSTDFSPSGIIQVSKFGKAELLVLMSKYIACVSCTETNRRDLQCYA